jgi:NAD/NADP transhydrogenase beta subunit
MLPIAGIFVALLWCTTALLIAWSRGYSPLAIVLCLVCIIGGSVAAGLPGAYALTGWSLVARSQAEGTMECAAILIGAMCGLYVAERIRDGQFPSLRQLMTAFFGFLFGLAAAFFILAFTNQSWARNLGIFALIPITIGSATLAGSAISSEEREESAK